MDKSSRIEKRRQELYRLKSEAASMDWLSDWWDNRKINRDIKSYKRNMRRFCKLFNNDFKDLEDFLTSRDPNGIAKAASLISRMSIQFKDLFVVDMEQYLELISKFLPQQSNLPPSQQSNVPTESIDNWENIEKNIRELQFRIRPILVNIENPDIKKKIDDLSNILETKMASLAIIDSEQGAENLKKEIFSIFNELQNELSEFQNVHASPNDIITSKKKQEEIAKIAHNTITRWINRQLMSINPSKEDMMKLRCVESIHKAQLSCKNLSRSLDSDIDEIKKTAKIFYDSFSETILRMSNLTRDYIIMQPTRSNKETIRLNEKSVRLLTNMAAFVNQKSEQLNG